MKPYTKLYMKSCGYDIGDFIPCELSGQPAVDIHHIDSRGMGGSKNKDRIENLMAVTRENHVKFGDKTQYMVFLYKTHREFLKSKGVKYDDNYFEQQIKRYE